MEIINFILDLLNSPLGWLSGILFFLGYSWTTKDNDDIVQAAHINDLQTKKLDNDIAFINETANANMTYGLTINQGAEDDEIFALKSSDVAHGMTDETETDTYGFIEKYAAILGGVSLYGLSESTVGISLKAMCGVPITDKTTAAEAPFMIESFKRSGTAAVAMGANENVFVARNSGSTIFILDAEGDLKIWGALTATTAKLSGLTDGYIPYHVDDATGLANSNIFTDGTKVFIGDTANAKMAQGLTINQGQNDDEILAFKSPTDVAHGVTTIAETDTFGYFEKVGNTDGGLRIGGLTEGTVGFHALIVATTGNTTKNASGLAPASIDVGKKNGTGVVAFADDENLLVIRTNGGTRFIFDEDGDMYYDGAAPANYDEFDDPAACHDVARHLYNVRRPVKERLTDFIKYNKADLVAMGVISDGDFVSTKGMTALILGAISQLYKENQLLQNKIKQLDH